MLTCWIVQMGSSIASISIIFWYEDWNIRSIHILLYWWSRMKQNKLTSIIICLSIELSMWFLRLYWPLVLNDYFQHNYSNWRIHSFIASQLLSFSWNDGRVTRLICSRKEKERKIQLPICNTKYLAGLKVQERWNHNHFEAAMKGLMGSLLYLHSVSCMHAGRQGLLLHQLDHCCWCSKLLPKHPKEFFNNWSHISTDWWGNGVRLNWRNGVLWTALLAEEHASNRTIQLPIGCSPEVPSPTWWMLESDRRSINIGVVWWHCFIFLGLYCMQEFELANQIAESMFYYVITTA